MQLLKGKKILITGITNKLSIGFGIAKSMYEHGAELALTCQNDKLKKRILLFSEEIGTKIVITCDVTDDMNIVKLFKELSGIWDKFDGLVHAIAFSLKSHLSGNYIETITKEGFRIAHDVSSYSFVAMVRECMNILNENSSLITLSYLGSKRAIPNYNVMGLAKASLESNVRYMANSLGAKLIRVNGISSGPIKTASSLGIKNFKQYLNNFLSIAPIKKMITTRNIGNVATFLSSNLSIGITGQIIYVDNGFNIL
ncbi:MAG TPA: SDR family oxidoreductase [Buchnera sp. (in: enterobacteria)]|nr:SDR family oxidoreductase [Buchnera sp. (in: enterobacteria)]